MNSIGLTLKKLRLESKLNWQDIITRMNKEYNIEIAKSTIYGYENNNRTPNANIFLALCQIYKCDDLFYEFGYTKEKNKFLFSNEENILLHNYRKLDKSGKNIIKKALDIY